jgi:hypothetical protein
MDDAGTGHSNLAYMQTLGIDVIKIDRIFVDMIKDLMGGHGAWKKGVGLWWCEWAPIDRKQAPQTCDE